MLAQVFQCYQWLLVCGTCEFSVLKVDKKFWVWGRMCWLKYCVMFVKTAFIKFSLKVQNNVIIPKGSTVPVYFSDRF